MTHANFDRIESYLFGQMPAAERADFEHQLAADAALASELATQRAEHRAMELLLQAELRANMNAWKAERAQQAEQHRSQMGVSFSRRQIMQWAAAACLLLVATYWGISTFVLRSQLDPEAMMLETATAMKGNAADVPAALAPALAVMKKDDFAAALALLEQANDPDFAETASLLKAECFFRLKKYDDGIAALLPVAQAPIAPENGEKAEWMLALSYLAKGDKTTAKTWNDKILADPNHAFRKNAAQLKSAW